MGITSKELQDLLQDNPDIVIVGDDRPQRTPHIVAVTDVTPSEHDEQVALFEWAAANTAVHPELLCMFAIPNGSQRHPVVGAMLKMEGVKAGVPDIFLACRRGHQAGIFIELKRADHSNHATPEQSMWIQRLRHYGYSAVICFGAQDAINTIMAYLAQEG